MNKIMIKKREEESYDAKIKEREKERKQK